MTTPVHSVDYELWRRAQEHREASLVAGAGEIDQMLVPLILALARLAAQREVRRVHAGEHKERWR